MYDNLCKFLVETYSQDYAQWLLGEAVGLTELDLTELAVDPIRADAIVLMQGRSRILHLEFQTQPDPDIPFRMADYRLRLFRRFPDIPVRQVVLYLKPTGSVLVQQTTFTLDTTQHTFEVIRLWEVPVADLLPFAGLLPLAILGRSDNKP